jgi:eukaryotic-like serine/threonine-protein kinase
MSPRFRRRDEAETVVEGAPEVVEEEELVPPPPPPRRPLIWPWLLLLLLLVAGGLIALWLLTRDDGGSEASTVNVPNVVRLQQREAVDRLNDRGLIARTITRTAEAQAGTVLNQDPEPGADVTRRSVVTLVVSAAQVVAVPNVVGKQAGTAGRTLRAQGFQVDTSAVASNKPRGTVVGQQPAAATEVAKGSTVLIRVSRGQVTVPDVVGQSRDSAVATMRAAGLAPKAFSVSSEEPRGTGVAQSPRAGARAPGGSAVRLNVSNGQAGTGGGGGSVPPPPLPTKPTTVTVPDVTGQPQETAQRQLNSAGLKAGVVFVPSDEAEGTVVSQSPRAGTRQRRGARIQLNVSLGPSPGEQRAVPDVVGQEPAAARSALESAGFEVQVLNLGVTDASQVGKVVDVQPSSGRRAPVGSTVTIYVGKRA